MNEKKTKKNYILFILNNFNIFVFFLIYNNNK